MLTDFQNSFTVRLSRKFVTNSFKYPTTLIVLLHYLVKYLCSKNRSRCRTLPLAWSQAPVGVTISHQCYSSCTGCLYACALCSRSRGSYIIRLSDWLPRTSQTTVAFCRTLAVAHCGPIPMTCGSCLCHEYITNSVIGVFRPPVLDCGTTFHLDYGGRDLHSTLSIFENSFIWRPKRLVTLLNL